MKVWSDDDYGDCKYLLVPHHLKAEFREAIECDMFEKPLEEVWLLSASAAETEDLKLISRLLTNVFGYSSSGNKIDFVEIIDNHIKEGSFSLIPESLKSIGKKSHIGSKILNALSELFYAYNFMKDNIVIFGPIDSTSVNWVDDELLFSQSIVNEINMSSYQHCHIKAEISKNSEQLKTCIEIYKELNPYKKLAFLASYFLHCSVYYINSRDYSYATIFLHRAVETIFISWLIQEQELHLNVTLEGKNKDSAPIYLLGYMNLVLKKRSLTDDEKNAVKKLNKLRNCSKLAHGYKIVSKEDLESVFSILKSMILSETSCQEHFLRWDSITKIPNDFYNLIYNYLTKNNYIEKFSC